MFNVVKFKYDYLTISGNTIKVAYDMDRLQIDDVITNLYEVASYVSLDRLNYCQFSYYRIDGEMKQITNNIPDTVIDTDLKLVQAGGANHYLIAVRGFLERFLEGRLTKEDLNGQNPSGQYDASKYIKVVEFALNFKEAVPHTAYGNQ